MNHVENTFRIFFVHALSLKPAILQRIALKSTSHAKYTGCPILNNTLKYLRNGALNKKMFQTKVVWLEGGHQMVAMI